MKVLHVNDYEFGGGAELMVGETMRLLEQHGVETELFSGDTPDLGERTLATYIHNNTAVARIEATIQTFRPDVVHFHNVYHRLSPSVLTVPRRMGVERVVFSAHDHAIWCPNPSGRRFVRGEYQPIQSARLGKFDVTTRRWDRSWGRSQARKAQFIVAHGVRHVLDGVDVIHGFNSRQMRHLRELGFARKIAHPIPSELPERRHDPNGRVVFVGRIVEEKGLAQFLTVAPVEALDRLVVIGDGPERSACEQIVEKRGAATEFLGTKPHEQTLDIVAGATAVVVPSRSEETGPLVVLEALCLGVDVLGSALGGAVEMTGAVGAGYLFDPFDPASIIRETRRFLERGPHDFDPAPLFEGRCQDQYVNGLLRMYSEPTQS